MTLAGDRALITGASRGLGRAIALAFAARGARLALSGRDRGALEAVVAECRTLGAEASAVPADLSRVDEADRLAAEAGGLWGGIDVLVNNAGAYGPAGPFESIASQSWEGLFALDLFSPARLCRALMPGMRERRLGRVVNVSGGGATQPLPRLSAYAAAKAGLVRLSETLALEAAGSGVTVNALAPGLLPTRMNERLRAAGPEASGPQMHEKLSKLEPGDGSLERAAACCAFLCSKRAGAISGRLISAVWDPWERLAEKADALSASDVYTLRRIRPEDRGFSW